MDRLNILSMSHFWSANHLDQFIQELNNDGYSVVGPRLKNQAILYDKISSIEDLPQGWTEEQAPGHYRVKKRNDSAFFGYVVGPHSWKQFLHPAHETLWRAKKTEAGIQVEETPPQPKKLALLGARSCDLSSIDILDKVFHDNANFKSRRQDNFIVAVNCIESGKNCFCTSMQTGPKAKTGFDLSLTEIIGEGFVVAAGTAEGEKWIQKISDVEATTDQLNQTEAKLSSCAENMSKQMETGGLKELLYNNLDHPIWTDIAKTCLACANCTMVCPTCFCSTVEDHTDLTGTETSQVRRWDSCFNPGHSYVHGGSVHHTTASKYRQWMTHKLASWHDQFDSSGCTGCGRCITWCPVGIDLTEEVKKLRGEN